MARLVQPRSVLAVRDLAASTRFYVDVLGFERDDIEAPGWSFLSRDSIRIMLGECPDEVDAEATGNHSWFLHVMVEDLDALHAEVRGRGADIVVPIGDRSHGHREFVLRTPDGHRILFGEPLEWIRRGPVRTFLLAALVALGTACAQPAADAVDLASVEAEIEALVWTFHAADTAMDAEAVVGLLWPDYEMLVDGQRLSFGDVAAGSRDFMASLEFFHTTWNDLEIIPLSPDFAVASFTFRDSIMTSGGDLVQSRGPTTLLWERRNGEWRMRFGDADHYPISP